MSTRAVVFVALLVALSAFTPAAAAGPATAQEEPTCEYPLELEDGTGETVTIDDEPDSVVALQPSDAQSLFEIGAEEKIVGMPVGQYTDYLGADADLDITEDDDVTPVAETVIDRDPDVVLAANALETDPVIEQLREAGLTVYVFPTEESLDGVEENVRLTGEIVGECEGAADSIAWMNERLDAVEANVTDDDRPLTYYAMGGGVTAGEGTFQDELLRVAGVENLGSEAGIEGWQEISEEVVVEEDPEWIIYDDTFDEPPVGEAVMGTTAYENDQIIEVNSNYLNQPGPLVVLAIEEIVDTVHATDDADEGATDDADEGATDDEPAEADDEVDDDATAEASDDSIPGFGVPAVIAALFAYVIASRRAGGSF